VRRSPDAKIATNLAHLPALVRANQNCWRLIGNEPNNANPAAGDGMAYGADRYLLELVPLGAGLQEHAAGSTSYPDIT
jgi:hypothetical protein